MHTVLGTPLPRGPVARRWCLAAATSAAFLALGAFSGILPLVPALIAAGLAGVIGLAPLLGVPGAETYQLDDSGIIRVEGHVHESVRWSELTEIRVIVRCRSRYEREIFIALEGGERTGCLVMNDAALRLGLADELLARVPGLDGEMLAAALNYSGHMTFTVWRGEGAPCNTNHWHVAR